jgi:uncharacterized protein (TIGR03382 family)
MKKIALALAVVSAFAAQAQSNVYFYVDGATQNNWNLSGLSLNVDQFTGAALLTGNMTRAGSTANYRLDVAFTTPYTNAAGLTQWQNLVGTIVNTTRPSIAGTQAIIDFQAGRGAMDSVIGLNASPYNSATSRFELGFWAYNASSTQRHDFNVTLTCSSGPANANGSCATGGTNVPLPGTLALFGLAALGLGARRIKLV